MPRLAPLVVTPATPLPSGRTEGTGAPAREDGRGAGISRYARRCHAEGCTRHVPASSLFCHTHWHRLPGSVRNGLYGRGYANPSENIRRLIARAVAMLAENDGRH